MAGPHEPARGASPLFLTEPEIRRGIEALHFGNARLTQAIRPVLDAHGLGRAHQRAMYFIARHPNVAVGTLLGLLAISKQSLGRVIIDLTARGLVESRPGDRDRRQRLLRLTPAGAAIERELFAGLAAALATAYSRAGQDAVGGFWAVLEGLSPPRFRPA